ncbi:MAG TPA: type II toxin-antitoxin system RelE/ParE family toxin [Blastocatellia bacterium]|nr:type II toxin-antitoxin system RelE/ParE family toxin [Blastocatellia bacterium]
MTRQINVTDTAKADLKQIHEYIARNNAEAASRLVREITRKFAALRDHPLTGRPRDCLLLNLRSFPVRKYVIFYQPFEDRIDILRVLHSSRDIDSEFERFFESL